MKIGFNVGRNIGICIGSSEFIRFFGFDVYIVTDCFCRSGIICCTSPRDDYVGIFFFYLHICIIHELRSFVHGQIAGQIVRNDPVEPVRFFRSPSTDRVVQSTVMVEINEVSIGFVRVNIVIQVFTGKTIVSVVVIQVGK